MSAAQPQAVIQPSEQGAKTIELKWSVTFDQKFTVDAPLTQAEYVTLAKDHLEWLKEDFLKQLESYPGELFKVLGKYDLLQLETFQKKGKNGDAPAT